MLGVIHADSFGLQNFTRRYFQIVIFNPNIFAKNIHAVESFIHAEIPANPAWPVNPLARRNLAIILHHASYQNGRRIIFFFRNDIQAIMHSVNKISVNRPRFFIQSFRSFRPAVRCVASQIIFSAISLCFNNHSF